eukprot:CAMPEP_0169119686 /NCGR_PEP_ID=MMETSP1015-20121227/31696_1 /TAXON_ID=342587 /ORGANISM="Karlodinium micrum, Strain CCMP2283" /LENGTH=120 /DNA_ID=CAMNT_0009182597 /DNA_START=484 /DNA_END=844 /DNA_ORIENTATION=-
MRNPYFSVTCKTSCKCAASRLRRFTSGPTAALVSSQVFQAWSTSRLNELNSSKRAAVTFLASYASLLNDKPCTKIGDDVLKARMTTFAILPIAAADDGTPNIFSRPSGVHMHHPGSAGCL